MAITFRADKGVALTYTELDNNFGNFFTDAEISGSKLILHYATSSNVPVSESAVSLDFLDFSSSPGEPEASVQFNRGGEFGGSERLIYSEDNSCLGVGYDIATVQTSQHKLIVDGSIEASGNIYAFSDITVKSDLNVIEQATEIISSLTGYSYNKDGKEDVGLIAQDVKKVLPAAVKQGTNEKLGLNYNAVVGVLVEAVKSLTKRIDELENR